VTCEIETHQARGEAGCGTAAGGAASVAEPVLRGENPELAIACWPGNMCGSDQARAWKRPSVAVTARTLETVKRDKYLADRTCEHAGTCAPARTQTPARRARYFAGLTAAAIEGTGAAAERDLEMKRSV
jgi:hypothetical protein